MSEPYLILHKVRGEPAFDIAEKIMIGDEEGWVIPTSGHRAYPWAAMLLQHVMDVGWIQVPREPIPDDWPDHYDTKRDQTDMIDKFRAILGLNKPKPANNYRRR
jgi:hypothetical protein